MRGADPAIVLVPGVGMFSFGADKQTARVAGEFYLNAINVMRGAEAVSTYPPIDEARSSASSTGSWRRPSCAAAQAEAAGRPGRAGHRGRLGIGRAIAQRLAAEGACVVVADRDAGRPRRWPPSSAGRADRGDVAVGGTVDVTDEDAVAAAFDAAALAFGGVDLVVNNAGLSISKPLLETTAADWDLQHDVMARGSFLVSREAARVMTAQGMGGDIVYICSKNAVFAGPNNVAYGAAKADQAHQVRLLAAELGGTASGSTGSTRTGWSAARASSPAAGARSGPPCTACPRTSSARSTRSGRCSSARCCPSTWRRPCSR